MIKIVPISSCVEWGSPVTGTRWSYLFRRRLPKQIRLRSSANIWFSPSFKSAEKTTQFFAGGALIIQKIRSPKGLLLCRLTCHSIGRSLRTGFWFDMVDPYLIRYWRTFNNPKQFVIVAGNRIYGGWTFGAIWSCSYCLFDRNFHCGCSIVLFYFDFKQSPHQFRRNSTNSKVRQDDDEMLIEKCKQRAVLILDWSVQITKSYIVLKL